MTNFIHTYTKKAWENVEDLRSWLEKNESIGQGHERMSKHDQRKIQDVFSDTGYLGTPEPTYAFLDKKVCRKEYPSPFEKISDVGNEADEHEGLLDEFHSDSPQKLLNPLLRNDPSYDPNKSDDSQYLKRERERFKKGMLYLCDTNFPDIIMN